MGGVLDPDRMEDADSVLGPGGKNTPQKGKKYFLKMANHMPKQEPNLIIFALYIFLLNCCKNLVFILHY